jgi:hypothetical protein
MSQPEDEPPEVRPDFPHYGRYVAIPAIAILILITVNTLVTKPNGVTGLSPGQRVPPFATPLALGSLKKGESNIAEHAHEGARGNVAACSLRSAQILNICELDEHNPVVLALIIDSGSCPDVLGDLQALAPSFPGVRFAAVAIHTKSAPMRRLIAKRGLTYPVGFDEGAALLALYKVATCPQLTFILPGGTARGKALLVRPSRAVLRGRIEDLVRAATARGWKAPAR